MATSKKAADKAAGGRSSVAKEKPVKASSSKPAAVKTTRTIAAKTADKSPAKTVKSPAAKIAKAVATKAVKAVTKKVSETVSTIAKKAKSASSKTSASKAPATRAIAVAQPKVAVRTSSKAVSAKATAAAKPEAKKVTSTKTPATGTPRKRVGSKPGKSAATAIALVEKEFSGSESFRPEEQIQDINPTEVRERFFHEHRGGPPPAPEARELPNEYGDTKIVLLVRDPEWVYAYWEINDAKRDELKLSRNGHSRRTVIRLYKVSERQWPEEGAHYFFDIDVSPYALNWYIKLPEPAQQWCAELGIIDEENNYVAICRSNVIGTPRNSISEETDSEWMVVEETFHKLSKLGGVGGRQVAGLTTSRGASETLLRQLQRQVTGMLRVEGSGMSSGSLYSGSLVEGNGGVAVAKDFWLQVDTEVILYGATEANAVVTVQDRPVKLDSEGRFSIRFHLPDGQQELRVHAVNAEGDMDRTITPVVIKRTVGS